MRRDSELSELNQSSNYDDDSTERLWYPTWSDQPRGFVDFPRQAAGALQQFLSQHLPSAIKSWSGDRDTWFFQLEDLEIQLASTDHGLIVAAASDTISRRWLDPLRWRLRDILHVALGEVSWSDVGFAVMLLQMAEEAAICSVEVAAWSSQELGTDTNGLNQGYDATSVYDWSLTVDHPFGVNLLTVDDVASHLLGASITDICKTVPSHMRILHAEPVFRNDLVQRFRTRQSMIRQDLTGLSYGDLRASIPHNSLRQGGIAKSRDGLIDWLSNPRVTFHGTLRRAVQSIVRYGLLVPGSRVGNTHESVEVANGATFGAGIYSSPDPWYASLYTDHYGDNIFQRAKNPSEIPGFRLLICATLMGRPFEVSRDRARWAPSVLHVNAHSHVCPNHMEYVVFDAAQILPCYVLHVDYGADEAKRAFDHMPQYGHDVARPWAAKDFRHETAYTAEDDNSCPGAVQAKKRALKSAATKWFPYGYGPATGTSFVVEEIGEVSDDEEVYGEFQYERIEREEREKQALGAFDDRKRSWFDEYQTVRGTRKEVSMKS